MFFCAAEVHYKFSCWNNWSEITWKIDGSFEQCLKTLNHWRIILIATKTTQNSKIVWLINELSHISVLLSKAMEDCPHYLQLNIILIESIQKSAWYQQINAIQFYSMENISIFPDPKANERQKIKMKEFSKRKLWKFQYDENSNLSSNHKHVFPLSSKTCESAWKNVCDTNNFYRLQRFYAPLICNSQILHPVELCSVQMHFIIKWNDAFHTAMEWNNLERKCTVISIFMHRRWIVDTMFGLVSFFLFLSTVLTKF